MSLLPKQTICCVDYLIRCGFFSCIESRIYSFVDEGMQCVGHRDKRMKLQWKPNTSKTGLTWFMFHLSMSRRMHSKHLHINHFFCHIATLCKFYVNWFPFVSRFGMNDTMDSCRLSFENNSIAFLISTEWINEYQFITTQSSHFVDYIFIKQIIFFIHILWLHLLSVLRWLFFVPNKLFVYGFDKRTKRNRNNSIDHSAGHFVCVCLFFCVFLCLFCSFHFVGIYNFFCLVSFVALFTHYNLTLEWETYGWYCMINFCHWHVNHNIICEKSPLERRNVTTIIISFLRISLLTNLKTNRAKTKVSDFTCTNE